MKVKRRIGEVAERLEHARVVGIVRLADARTVVAACTEAVARGLRAVEVPSTVPGAGRAISELRSQLEGTVLVGAGTIRTRAQLEEAIAAGAEFLVAPGLNPELVEATAAAGLLFLPGVYTASEVDRALELGLRFLKLFPAEPAGPGYLAALLQPFPEARFVPTGGIGPGNAAAFLRAGAVALGMGSSIFPPKLIAAEGLQVVRGLVDEAMAAVGRGEG